MSEQGVPTLTIFAGPNGSGKSTLRNKIVKSGYDLGFYINADDIVAELRQARMVGKLAALDQTEMEIEAFHEAGRRRERCLGKGRDFSFETVFSHISKVEFIARAKARGFVVRLFFVGVEDPQLNVERVLYRVSKGGHSVPVEKIISRYSRAMRHLLLAFEHVDEAIIFDNSDARMRPVVHFTKIEQDAPENRPEIRPKIRVVEPVPLWVKKILEALPL